MLVKADARRSIPLADGSVHAIVTSPPYWNLRDYGIEGQIGLEATPKEFIGILVNVFREVRRVLRDDGVLFLNIGDSYSATGSGAAGKELAYQGESAKRRKARSPSPGLKPKDLVGIPWMLAFALRADSWYLRQECIWDKTNAMPESVRDRPARAHEQVFLFSKSSRYYYDEVAERKPQKTLGLRHEGKSGYREGHPSKGGIKARALNPLGGAVRSVWRISSKSYKGAHFATMPVDLAARCIRLGSSAKGCCPACGSPWRQVIERERIPTRPGTNTKVQKADVGYAVRHNVVGNRDPERYTTSIRVVGWESSCTCREPNPAPCTIFDPFAGAATTGVAAEWLGRNFIGTDLSAEYLALSSDRLSRPHAPVRKPASASEPPMPLWDAIPIVPNPSLSPDRARKSLSGRLSLLGDAL